MERYGEICITIGTLGIVITLIGLFPGIIGLETTAGIGVLQVLVILAGFSVLFTGAFLFAKQAFYAGMESTLAQDIGLRLTLTGLLIAAAAGLADVLGFGSHPSSSSTRPLLGHLQAVGFISGILIASSGVLIYALFGPQNLDSEPSDQDDDTADDTPTR